MLNIENGKVILTQNGDTVSVDVGLLLKIGIPKTKDIIHLGKGVILRKYQGVIIIETNHKKLLYSYAEYKDIVEEIRKIIGIWS